ncbi:MAG: helix-turn-helix domain-containing protein [Ruminococcus sp. SR1/5]|nr:helix-turn-helix domain-containing protein [Ruminococcus sp.]
MKYNFPEDLRSIRAILGLSQREFAEQIGVEQVTVSRNELGKQFRLQEFWRMYTDLHLQKI